MRWMPRIATSGWLISGVTKRPAALPALVIVNVPPRSSSGCECAGLRGLGEAPNLGVEVVERERVRAVDDGDDEALLGLDGDAEVVAVEQHELAVLDASVELGELLQRLGDGLDDERPSRLLRSTPREVALLDPGHGRDLGCARVRCSNIWPLHAAQLNMRRLRIWPRAHRRPPRGRRPR